MVSPGSPLSRVSAVLKASDIHQNLHHCGHFTGIDRRCFTIPSGPIFLTSKMNVAGSIPVTRFQKPLRMALKTIPRDLGFKVSLIRSLA